jgi:hypothetical protein
MLRLEEGCIFDVPFSGADQRTVCFAAFGEDRLGEGTTTDDQM